jgi:hypothetical protein
LVNSFMLALRSVLLGRRLRPDDITGLREAGLQAARRRRIKVVTRTGVYRTEQGTIFRISEGDEGHLSVQLLDRPLWVAGPIGMAGLRLSPTTTRLTARQVQALPA